MTTPDSLLPWEIPPDDWLQPLHRSCSTAATWVAAFISVKYQNTTYHDPPIEATWDYMKTMTPENMTLPDVGQAMDWYYDIPSNSFTDQLMFEFPTLNCPAEVCHRLVWEGDQDLAGIGVSYSTP